MVHRDQNFRAINTALASQFQGRLVSPFRAAKDRCAHTSATERANIVNQIADRMEANLELLGVARICNNSKPIREMRAADLPLAIDHFGYFTSCARRRAR